MIAMWLIDYKPHVKQFLNIIIPSPAVSRYFKKADLVTAVGIVSPGIEIFIVND